MITEFVFVLILVLSMTGCGKGRSEINKNINSTGEKRILSDRFGCIDRDYFDKLYGYIAQKDSEAFSKALSVGLATGTCTMFKKGEIVYTEDTDFSDMIGGNIKIRRKGEMRVWWTATEAIHGEH